MTGSFSLANLLLGLALGGLALFLVRDSLGAGGTFLRTRRAAALLALFVEELVRSAWRVAVLVLSPRLVVRPGILAYPLTVDRDIEITLLANLITLTPGTLSVDVSDDRRTLFVHALDCADPERTVAEIRAAFERRILEALR